ncbi:MAG: PAS domain S-box protein [Spirochaetales bacterium]|nr:PAS domain S-box protein [Spirochaetales bacterium]
MGSEKKDSANVDIILATSIEKERNKLIQMLNERNLPFNVHCPEKLSELDKITSDYEIKLIITDMDFQNGSLVDWLVLWPYPFILLVDLEESEKIDKVLSDESSSFLLRRKNFSHLNYLPSMLRKVLNIRESLERHNNFLKISEKQYMNLVQALPDIIYVLDTEGNFTFINNAIRILGWDPVELIGRHFTELLFHDDVPKVSRGELLPALRGVVTGEDRSPKLFDERRTGSRMTRGLQLKLRRKPSIGGSINVSLTAYGEVSSIGYSGFQQNDMEGVGTAGIIRENNLQLDSPFSQNRAESIFATEGALAHNEVMHLINNKLQVLSSLVSLKQSLCNEPISCMALNEVQIQIYTLSLVYQNMVTINDKIKINMQSYMDDIIKHLISSYAGNPWMQKIELHCDTINLPEDSAITISLLVTELLTLILKIQDKVNSGIVPTTITFLVNDSIAQLKIRATEKIFSSYAEIIEDESSKIMIQTLVETLKGEIFLDKESFTLFFNIG